MMILMMIIRKGVSSSWQIMGARTATFAAAAASNVRQPRPLRLRVPTDSQGGACCWYNNSGGQPQDEESSSSATNQHQMFLEQMNELQAEQQQLFGVSTSDEAFDFTIVQQQQQQQQMTTRTVVTDLDDGSEPTDDDDGVGDLLSPPAVADNHGELEQMKQDRERLYGFTEQEHVAWGAYGQRQQQTITLMQQQQLDEITQRRREHFDRIDQLNAFAAEQEDSSHQPQSASTVVTASSTPPPSSFLGGGGGDHTKDRSSHGLSHVSADGTALHMVDVSAKPLTTRIATAETIVQFPPAVVTALRQQQQPGEDGFSSIQPTTPLLLTKGPVFATAITAGIMAAKQTSNLIPLCHPLLLSHVDVSIQWLPQPPPGSTTTTTTTAAIRITCQCTIAHGSTGVEMEALVGSTVAALTVYDMVKAISHDVILSHTRLIHKEGGKRHFDLRP